MPRKRRLAVMLAAESAAAAADADADGEPPAPERRKSQFTQPEGQ